MESIRHELALRGQSLKYQLYEIGRLLCEVRRVLPHGEFKPWVEQYFEHTYRTAVNCMRVYRACMAQPELVEYFSPSCLYVICAPNFPRDLRDALFTNAKGPVDINKARLVEVALKYKNDEIELDDPAVQSLLHKQCELNLRSRLLIELKALRTLVKNRLRQIDALVDRRIAQPLLVERAPVGEWFSEITARIVDFTADLRHAIKGLEEQTENTEVPDLHPLREQLERQMGFSRKDDLCHEVRKLIKRNSFTNETVSPESSIDDNDLPF